MLVTVILIGVALLIALIVVFIVLHKKKAERTKYHTAAGNTLREEYLNYSLQNQSGSCGLLEKSGYKAMIYIKTRLRNKKIQYVFNPEKSILIGRDKYESNIYVSDHTVSKKHCRICLCDGQVCLEDLNAANGTIVKRGFRKKYNIYGGNRIRLRTNDKIIIGSSVFKVVLFSYDMSTL